MGWSLFALGVTVALCALALVMDRNGRKADQARGANHQ
jgi:hypothetical protein